MTITTLSTDASPELVARINAAHNACVARYRDALEHAIDCGELLYQVRKRLAPGTWGRWVADNFAGDERTARGYMQIAHADHQDPKGLRANAGGSVQAAVAYLSRQIGGVTHTTFGSAAAGDDRRGAAPAAVPVELRYVVTRAQLEDLAGACGAVDAAASVERWLSAGDVEAAE